MNKAIMPLLLPNPVHLMKILIKLIGSLINPYFRNFVGVIARAISIYFFCAALHFNFVGNYKKNMVFEKI